MQSLDYQPLLCWHVFLSFGRRCHRSMHVCIDRMDGISMGDAHTQALVKGSATYPTRRTEQSRSRLGQNLVLILFDVNFVDFLAFNLAELV